MCDDNKDDISIGEQVEAAVYKDISKDPSTWQQHPSKDPSKWKQHLEKTNKAVTHYFLLGLSSSLMLIGLILFLDSTLKPFIVTLSKDTPFWETLFCLYLKENTTVLFLKIADKILISLTVLFAGHILFDAVYKSKKTEKLIETIHGIDKSILSMVTITLSVSYLAAILDGKHTDMTYGFSISSVILSIALYIYFSHKK